MYNTVKDHFFFFLNLSFQTQHFNTPPPLHHPWIFIYHAIVWQWHRAYDSGITMWDWDRGCFAFIASPFDELYVYFQFREVAVIWDLQIRDYLITQANQVLSFIFTNYLLSYDGWRHSFSISILSPSNFMEQLLTDYIIYMVYIYSLYKRKCRFY